MFFMARRNMNTDSSYFRRRQEAEEQQGQRTFNIQQAVAERMGARPNLLDQGNTGYNPFGPGYEVVVAPTTNLSLPRARVMGYNRSTETLVIIFRDGKWIMYTDPVPVDMWEDLRVTDSTGKYLKYSGIDDLNWTEVTNQPGMLPRKPAENMQYGSEEGR